MNTPILLTATAYFYYVATLLVQTAAFVGNEAEQRFFAQWKKTIYEAFNKEIFNPDTRQYGTGSQVSNAIVLYFGLVDEPHRTAVLEHIVDDIRACENRLTSGDIETKWRKQDGHVSVGVVVPVNTSATVVLEHFDVASAKINGVNMAKAKDVQEQAEGSNLRVTLGSGTYTLEMRLS